MGRWGLRWIFCWLSVLVTACTQIASPTPAEKTQNRTPIQGFTPPPTASPTEPVRPAYTLTPLGSHTPSNQINEDGNESLELASLTCYESPVQSLICLGWIDNISDTPITNVLIDVYLLTPQGIPIETKQVLPALSILPAQSGSPFRAIFEQVPSTKWTAYSELRQSEIMAIELIDNRIIPIMVEQFDVEWASQSYTVSGNVINDGSVTLSQVWLVVTVRGEMETVTGYRVIELLEEVNLLQANELMSFSIQVSPLNGVEGQFISVDAQGAVDLQ